MFLLSFLKLSNLLPIFLWNILFILFMFVGSVLVIPSLLPEIHNLCSFSFIPDQFVNDFTNDGRLRK